MIKENKEERIRELEKQLAELSKKIFEDIRDKSFIHVEYGVVWYEMPIGVFVELEKKYMKKGELEE